MDKTPLRCRCGCDGIAQWLMTGTDYGGEQFVDEPACDQAASYCDEAAHALDLPFTKRRVQP